MTRSSFSLIRRQKASRINWMFCHCVIRFHTKLGCLLNVGVFHTASSVNATPNLGRYEASLEVIPTPHPWRSFQHLILGGHSNTHSLESSSSHTPFSFTSGLVIITSAKEVMFLPGFVCPFVCLFVNKITQ